LRALSNDEFLLKKPLKTHLLGLSGIEGARARQKSWLTWLRKGDINTRYFHIMANIRKRNNQILTQSSNTETATNQLDKHRLIFDHFKIHIGSCQQRRVKLNFEALGW
jgi:hypothetical protein